MPSPISNRIAALENKSRITFQLTSVLKLIYPDDQSDIVGELHGGSMSIARVLDLRDRILPNLAQEGVTLLFDEATDKAGNKLPTITRTLKKFFGPQREVSYGRSEKAIREFTRIRNLTFKVRINRKKLSSAA